MDNLIKDFTPLFSKEKTAQQQVKIQTQIANLLTLLNTHRLIITGGAELYIEKDGYKKVDTKDTLGYDLLDHHDLSRFMSTTIVPMAEAAYEDKGPVVIEIAAKLRDFNPENSDSAQALEKCWKQEEKLLEEMIYLYSEYLYKVFLDNPFKPELAGLKTTEEV